MTILITGGAGFIGQYVARALVARGHEVIAMDTLNAQVHADGEAAAKRFPGAVWRRDVALAESWDIPADVTGVVHLAAETGTAQSMYQREHYRRTNVGGSKYAAEFCEYRAIPLVLLSSRAVYGEGLVASEPQVSSEGRDCGASGLLLPSREEDAHRPLSYYGETKSQAEMVARVALEGGGRLAILRPQNVIGLGQALHNPYTGVLAAFLARLKAHLPLSVYGDGTQTRDFIHVSDVAAAICWALDACEAGTPLVANVGSGVRMTLRELAQYAIDAAPIEAVGVELVDVHRPGDIDHACADMVAAWDAGMPRPRLDGRAAVADFIQNSWLAQGADPELWEAALRELDQVKDQ
ncbi:MAG: NAD-dependent epimerase/dehydratase family protein [Bowdeniella nasicola]|nr:NAD-dependent epimerase/dehydratase family protein [Bowdeniella nasicola]